MLTDVVESGVAGSIGPKPAPASVVPSAVGVASGSTLGLTPEGYRNLVAASGPPPNGAVLGISDRAHPVLARGVAPATKIHSLPYTSNATFLNLNENL